MKSAFTREKNILEIMRVLVEIKVGSSDSSTVFRKIDELVGKLVEKKLGKKEISDLAYANAVDDREVKREIALRGISKAEDIECIQKKIYEFESKSWIQTPAFIPLEQYYHRKIYMEEKE